MNNASELDTVLGVCAHNHRRIVLASLAKEQQPMSINDLTNAVIKHNHHLPPTGTDDETFKRVYTGLYQFHIPKLANAEFIQYDPERNVADSKIQIGREDPNLSSILAMDSDLPTTSRYV